jgi:hypothetical protein
MLCIGMTAGVASASVLSAGETNKLFFKDFEIVFDKVVDPVTGDVTYEQRQFQFDITDLQVGDIFLGIIDIQEVTVGGTTYWDKDAGTDELTGIFIQEIKGLYFAPNDPFPNTNIPPVNTDELHVVLGAPTAGITLNTSYPTDAGADGMWGTADDVYTSGNIVVSNYLTGDEMMALFRDTGLSTFSETINILSDIDHATDGTPWATLGYSPGADGVYDDGPNPIPAPFTPSSDNDGYFYSHTSDMGTGVENFKGEIWAGLNLYENDTGYPFFTGVADGTELEYTGPWGPLGISILFDLILSGEFEMNEEWVLDPADGGYSNWVFASNDPGLMAPGIPEPATLLLLGSGLVGLAGFARRRGKKNLT